MALMQVQDRALLTATELALIELSEPSRMRAYTPAQLNIRIARARRLCDKYRDLARQQRRRTKKSQQPGRPQLFWNMRTERKGQIFAATLERFEQRLAQLTREGRRRPRPRAELIPKGLRRPGEQRETVRRKKQQAANEASLPRASRASFRNPRWVRFRGISARAERAAKPSVMPGEEPQNSTRVGAW